MLGGRSRLLRARRALAFVCIAALLVPDVSMLGYLFSKKLGAYVYNLFHSYTLPAALLAFGFFVGQPLTVSIALIWFAHIGMDRMIGYGLKYRSNFKDTHLSRRLEPLLEPHAKNMWTQIWKAR